MRVGVLRKARYGTGSAAPHQLPLGMEKEGMNAMSGCHQPGTKGL